MKKTFLKLATVLFAVAVATSSFAGENGGKPKGFNGKVSTVADGSITVSNKKNGDKTFKTNTETKVLKADGSAGSLSDLKSGAMIRVTAGSAPDQAATIQVVEKKKKDGAAKAPEKATE